MRIRLLALALGLLALATTVPAAGATVPVAGAADPSFADPGANSAVNAVAALPDGKVLIGGCFTGLAGTTRTYDYIARLNADGTVDDTFVNPHLAGFWWGGCDVVEAIAVQPDGKILLGGTVEKANADAGSPDFRPGLVRLNADGSFDGSFNANLDGPVTAIVVRPDGAIVIGGLFTSAGGETRIKLAGLGADGTLAETYNANPNSNVYALAIAPDGSVYVGGRFATANDSAGTPQAYHNLLRLKPDGTLDTAFADPGLDGDVRAIGVLPDGRVLAGGTFSSLLARFDADGTADGSFVNPNPNGPILSLAIQPDGKPIVGGWFTTIGGARSYVARLAGNGSVDTGFADPLLNSAVHAMALQPDGRLIAGGEFTEAGTDPHLGAIRLFASMPAGAPAAPIATAGAESATVSWTAVPGDITGYMVISIPDGRTCIATAPATACRVTGLKAGTAYRFRVSAANAFGDGVASLTAAVTPTAVPSAKGIRFHFARAQDAWVILTGVVTPSAGRLRITGTARGRTICTGAVRARFAGTHGLTCFTTAAGRRALARHGLRVTLRVRFAAPGAAAVYATRKLLVPRYAPTPTPTPVTG